MIMLCRNITDILKMCMKEFISDKNNILQLFNKASFHHCTSGFKYCLRVSAYLVKSAHLRAFVHEEV